MNRTIQFTVEVELNDELGLTSDEEARDLLEEMIRDSAMDGVYQVKPGLFVIEEG